MVISMVSIKVSIMVSIKVRQNINKMKWMNHISALRDFLSKFWPGQQERYLFMAELGYGTFGPLLEPKIGQNSQFSVL